ncbi:hypothetical protein B4N89_34830 [Embleya scabrispora]|uniref:Uncharacterized protein n=1 Tax=Embleya scabrispora TaxID=159449 RepID=A0A1T3NR18_9ACTN|nr:hypothetical protein [Embleya scabrispora]OPC79238.1 hypothetical protein B4N89_34830 [Embleya scabrispora]
MSEWGIALLAAGSALAGGLITGWFARGAGMRQADAARHAGDRQADALLETVRTTLDEQRAERLMDARRQTYLRFLEAAETVILTRRTGSGGHDDLPALQRAYGAVQLEGPTEVTDAARAFVAELRRNGPLDDLEQLRVALLSAAQAALIRR